MTERVRVVRSVVGWEPPQFLDQKRGVLIGLSSSATLDIDDGDVIASVVLGSDGTEMGFSRVTVTPGPASDGFLDRGTLRRLPWTQMIDALVLRATMPVEREERDDGTVMIFAPKDPDWLPIDGPGIESVGGIGKRKPGRPPGRRTGTDEERDAELRQVADLFREAEENYLPPAKFVAHRAGYSPATAGRRIKAARDAGYLEPVKRKDADR